MRHFNAFMAGCISLFLLFQPASAQETALRIGTEGAYPPFNYLDENHQPVGFDIDIAKALCAEMKVTCTFVLNDWDSMIPGLLAHKYDAIAASLSITGERKKEVLFTHKYYQTAASFTTSRKFAGNDTSPAAFKGKRIGAQMDTIHANYLQQAYAAAGADIKLYLTQQEAQIDLSRGNIDAVLADKILLQQWLQTNSGICCELRGADIINPAFFGEGVGIAVRKEDIGLKKRFDAALDRILRNGVYKRINDAYFPFSVY
jgi:lysine-arginine-ornithine-binding protein